MYNDVILNKPIKCAKCKAQIDEWQTKSMSYAGYDLANSLQALKINSRFSGEIHTSCNVCKSWAEYGVIKGQVVSKEDYDQFLTRLQGRLKKKDSYFKGLE